MKINKLNIDNIERGDLAVKLTLECKDEKEIVYVMEDQIKEETYKLKKALDELDKRLQAVMVVK